MGMSRLADRELYQHRDAPTLVAQLDPEAALAEGRAALELSQTTFVAETSLPTKYGRFRVRAYRHSVRPTRALWLLRRPGANMGSGSGCKDCACIRRLIVSTRPH